MRYFLILFTLILFSTTAFAKPEYAEKVGRDCVYCHVKSDGGALTLEGKKFLEETLRPYGFKRFLRIVLLYLHFLFGILWFGTILYVHIILKPGYASKGLPYGELYIGWVSIIVMFVTGSILTYMKISSFKEFFTTYFGIILFVKILLYFFMVATAFIVTFVLGPKMQKRNKANLELTKKGLTLDELSIFDGKENKPAYIAFNGEIYDLSSSRLWKKGNHMGRHTAGNDLTEAIKLAPHKEEVLVKFPKVGKLVSSSAKEKNRYISLFFFFAYTNLIIVFVIIFLITLWKW